MTDSRQLAQLNSALATPGPHSNTGPDSLTTLGSPYGVTAAIDHLTILWLKNGSLIINDYVERFIGVKFDLTNPIGRKIGVWWDRNWSSVCGCILSERDGADGQVYCRLSISGEACGRCNNARLRGFMIWCSRNLFGLRCSRIDIAVDDYCKKLQLHQLQEACEAGNYSGFRCCKSTVNYGERHGGWTINLGSRQGEKYIRIYDKYAESKGKIDAVRFEAEISGETSNVLFHLILEFPEEQEHYQEKLISYAIGTISFVDKVDKNIDRNLLLVWWEEWLEYLKVCPKKIKVVRIATSVERKKNWLRNAVSKSMAIVGDAIGTLAMGEFVCSILIDAKQRYTEWDKMLINDYMKVGVCQI